MGYKFNPFTGNLDETGTPTLVDTRANIIASTPTAGKQAFSTDYKRRYVADGTNWYEEAIEETARTGGYDVGLEKNSSLSGYGKDYVSDKTFHNVALKGHPATKQVGSFWIDTTVTPNVLHIYHDDDEKVIMTDFTMENDELEHHPLEFDIDVWSGNSNQLGANGLPLAQGYKTSMGAYPVPLLISGGAF